MRLAMKYRLSQVILLSLLEDFKKNYVPFGIPNAAFISKRQTPFTQDLYNRTIELLDNKFDELKSHPGKIPKDSFGMRHRDGSISKYPLDYVELGPELFHFSLYKFKDRVIHYDVVSSTKCNTV